MSWQPATLGEVLLSRAGSGEALVTPAGRLTYGDLIERAKQCAGGMQALGLGRGDPVGILLPNGADWLALFYGAALIGAVTVPVNTRFKAAEIDYCLRKSGCRAVFHTERFLGNNYAEMIGRCSVDVSFDVSKEALRGEYAPAPVHADDLLLIQFTSGTTAYPKGAMLTHDSMLRNAWAAGTRIGVRAKDR